ncbi:hypothetical protein [Streptomyces phytophilus]|uniref:hypothetical protein n=1 Tax=Streptomyces phytophilus TaxID=722715 RepID=UPI001C693E98|nr:hypothetical protein [Streptomyces phytophilus]
MEAGRLGCMTTPAQGNRVPDGALIGADNGCFGDGYPGDDQWFAWLAATVDRYRPGRFLFAVAPDVPFDAAGTLAKSPPWLTRIRTLGVPAAFAAQNGCDTLGVPWDDLDVLFLGGGPVDGPGSPEWKTGPAARRLALEALGRGKAVHMGRVNSHRRLAYARWIGCATADGTYLAFGPDRNLPKLLGWLDAVDRQDGLFGVAL